MIATLCWNLKRRNEVSLRPHPNPLKGGLGTRGEVGARSWLTLRTNSYIVGVNNFV